MILAIDQGTTGTTCLAVDARGEVVSRAYRELRQSFPRPGWVEHDPREIWEVSRAVAGEALDAAGVRPGGLAAVGIANQRETVVAWDPATGEPLHPALVWQDRRTAGRCDALRDSGLEPLVRDRTGLVLDPYFSATKVEWLLREVDGLAQRAREGRAVFGTIDAWLIARLTGGAAVVTEPSNASRTLLYDTAAGRWDPELCARFGVPERALPEVRPSCGEVARTDPHELFGHAVPIAGVLGDQQAALFGQGCVEPGAGKATFGTGAFILSTLEARPTEAPEGLLATVAWQIGDEVTHAVEAAIFVAGAAVQWLRDGLGIIAAAAETEGLAASLHGNDGVYFVPALTGLGSPHWDPYARGLVIGLTRGTGRAHLARAALEAMAYQACDAVRAMEAVAGEPLRELRADGAATANGWLMRFTADVLGVPVVVPAVLETTALGAALMAGVGVGSVDLADVGRMCGARVRYTPSMDEDTRATLLDGWHRALSRSRGWAAE